MLKAMKYRLYHTQKQATQLQQQFEECRWLYNHFLEQRKTSWEDQQEALSYHKQATALPALKQSRPSLACVHSQVLQNVAVRIDLAFKAFFRRCKAGEEPGYPRPAPWRPASRPLCAVRRQQLSGGGAGQEKGFGMPIRKIISVAPAVSVVCSTIGE